MTNLLTKTLLAIFTFTAICPGIWAQQTDHPNIILIIRDDQGYGDFGCTGNPHVKTPVLDRFAEENIRLKSVGFKLLIQVLAKTQKKRKGRRVLLSVSGFALFRVCLSVLCVKFTGQSS